MSAVIHTIQVSACLYDSDVELPQLRCIRARYNHRVGLWDTAAGAKLWRWSGRRCDSIQFRMPVNEAQTVTIFPSFQGRTIRSVLRICYSLSYANRLSSCYGFPDERSNGRIGDSLLPQWWMLVSRGKLRAPAWMDHRCVVIPITFDASMFPKGLWTADQACWHTLVNHKVTAYTASRYDPKEALIEYHVPDRI